MLVCIRDHFLNTFSLTKDKQTAGTRQLRFFFFFRFLFCMLSTRESLNLSGSHLDLCLCPFESIMSLEKGNRRSQMTVRWGWGVISVHLLRDGHVQGCLVAGETRRDVIVRWTCAWGSGKKKRPLWPIKLTNLCCTTETNIRVIDCPGLVWQNTVVFFFLSL